MRPRCLALLALGTAIELAVPVHSRADDKARQAPAGPAALAPTGSAPTGGVPGQMVQETTIEGTVPDLTGRWLAVGWLELAGGRQTTIPMFWEVTAKDGKPFLSQRFVDLPPAVKTIVDKNNADGQLWRPSADDLNRIASEWSNMPLLDSHVANVKTIITARDAFDDPIKNEPRSKDSKWVVRQRWDFDGKAGPLNRQVMVYSVMDENGSDYTGNLDSAMIASAPFPIPISFKGSFRLYRLSEPPSRGFLARFFDMFSGCGRQQPVS